MVLANKQNLILYKKNLGFLRKGLELLEYKRELLVRKIREISEQAFKEREEVNSRLKLAFHALADAYMVNGRMNIKLISESNIAHFRTKMREKSFMGIVLPEIQYLKMIDERPLDFGLYATSANLDRAVQEFQNVIDKLIPLAGIETQIYRLAAELNKIQRRINALDKIFIPEYEDTIKWIQFVLEEKERETITMTKVIKARLEKEAT